MLTGPGQEKIHLRAGVGVVWGAKWFEAQPQRERETFLVSNLLFPGCNLNSLNLFGVKPGGTSDLDYMDRVTEE